MTEQNAAAELKQRFQETLRRKNKLARDGEAHKDFVPEVNVTSGPRSPKRTFRRKTG